MRRNGPTNPKPCWLADIWDYNLDPSKPPNKSEKAIIFANMNDLSNPQNLFSNQPSKPQRVAKLQEHPILTIPFKQFLLENANKQSLPEDGRVITRNADIIVVKNDKEPIEKQRRNQVGSFAWISAEDLKK